MRGGHSSVCDVRASVVDRIGVAPSCVRRRLAVLLSGLYDLEPVALSYANEWMELDPEAVRRNSPVHFLPESGCPLIISYGGSETAEFKRQSEDYAGQWQAAGFELDCFELTERNHFDIPLELGIKGSVLSQKMLNLIG